MQKKWSPESLDTDDVFVSVKVGDSTCTRASAGTQDQKEYVPLPRNSTESANGVDRSHSKSADVGASLRYRKGIQMMWNVVWSDICADRVTPGLPTRGRKPWHSSQSFCFQNKINHYSDTVGPLIIESLWTKKRVSTGALGALDDPLVVQTKIWKSCWVPVDNTYHP